MLNVPACRVLVVDDDPTIGKLIETVLRRGPYDVTICYDAESALTRIKDTDRFDLIVTDFMLPGISGIDLITLFRNATPTASTPIVMISGHTNYAMEGRAIEAGADAFLGKPFTIPAFRRTVEALLRR